MNFSEATAAIRRRFAREWEDETPVAYDDVDFTPDGDAPWARLTIKHAVGYQATAGAPGSNRQRREGTIFVQIFTRPGGAGIKAMSLADRAADLFIGANEDGIYYFDTTVREVGTDQFGWNLTNVVTSFRYDRLA